MRTNRSNSRMK